MKLSPHLEDYFVEPLPIRADVGFGEMINVAAY